MNNYFGIYVQVLLAKNATTSLQKQLNAIKNLEVKVTPNFGKLNSSDVAKLNKDLKTELSSLQATANKTDITPKIDTDKINNATKSIDNLGKSMEGMAPEVKQAGQEMTSYERFTKGALDVTNDLLGTIGKVAVWSIATNAIYGTKNALKDLFETYVQLENQLISIERVTNNFDMKAIFEGAYASSQKYGASLTDMLGATEEIARSYGNLNEQQVLAAAEAGILASTIAEMDGKDAVGTIIAVSNAYGYAIENGEKLIDIANEVDNNFSVTAQTISTAWERSAATAKTFGVELENLTGYIAAISTVTQESGAVIGNSLKTIFSRITTMDAAIDSIKSAGVDVFDPITNEARDVQDVLKDLAGVWDELSATQQQSIGVNVAGRYQLTRFLALMNNWEIATDATNTALGAQGSAARENAVYMDSYQAKITQLENAQIKLSEAINNSSMQGAGKAFLDLKVGLTELLAVYFSVADSTVVFAGAIAGLVILLSKTTNGYNLMTGALKMFMKTEQAEIIVNKLSNTTMEKGFLIKKRNELVDKLMKVATKTKTAATVAETSATIANTTAKDANTAVTGSLTIANAAATIGATALAVALKLIPFVTVISLIGLLVGGITKWISSIAESNKALKEQNENIINNKQQIDGLKDKYNEARQARMDYENGKITNVQDYNTLLENEKNALKDVIDQYPALKKQLEDENISYQKKLELMEQADKKAQDAAKKELENNKKKIDAMNTANSLYKSNDYLAQNSPMGLNDDRFGNDYFASQAPGIQKYQEQANKNTELSTRQLETYTKQTKEYAASLKDYWGSVGDITSIEEEMILRLSELGSVNAKTANDFVNLNNVLTNFTEQASNGQLTVEGFEQALIDIGFSEEAAASATAAYRSSVEAATGAQSGFEEELALFNESCKNVIDTLFQLDEGAETAANNFLDFAKISSLFSDAALQEKIDGISSSLTFMGKSVWNANASLEDNITTIRAVSETLAIARTDEEAYADAISNGIMYVAKGRKDAMEAFKANKIEELKTERQTLQTKLEKLQAEVSAEESSADTTAKVCKFNATQLQKDMDNTTKWSTFTIDSWKAVDNAKKGVYSTPVKASKLDTSSTSISKSQKIKDVQSQIASLDKQINSWNNLKLVETTVDGFKNIGGSAGSAAKQTVDYFKIAEEALAKYKNAVEAIDNELKILQERNKQLVEGSQAWFDNYAAQEKVIARYQSSIKEYIRQIEIQMQNDKLSYDEKTKLLNKIQDLNLEYEKLNTTLYDNVQTQKKFYESQITDKLKLVQDLEKQRHKEALDNIKKERQAFQDQIKEQLNLMKKASAARSYEKELNDLQEERLNILSQISRLEGDDSRLAKSKLQDLYKELEEVEEKIGDLNYDRDVELREDALDDLSNELDDYYDKLEEMENEKNELITSSIDNAKDSLDIATQTIQELQAELAKWSNNLSNFSTWAQTFDSLIGTMPTSNIVSAMVPVNQIDADGNVTTTQIVFNISGSTSDAQNISDTIVDNLIKSGVITTGNTP